MNQVNWHQLSLAEIYQHLQANDQGLTSAEFWQRQKKYGKNELPKKKNDGFFKIMSRQIGDPIILLLIAMIFFSLMIKEYSDAIVVLFIILIDLLVATFQELKAGKNAQALANLIKVKAKVMRDNEEKEIEASDLVIGDLVLLESGNKISADARIVTCHNLSIDESILTGESTTVLKNADQITHQSALLAERKNMVYAGTSVITGRAKCIVTDIGIQTEVGKIADRISQTKESQSPLLIRMKRFSLQISFILGLVAVIITTLLLLKQTLLQDVFVFVIALLVSATPEGLPLAVTMALMIAANRMSKNHVIVKKLNAVESLGSCTVIASDKTGTLTVNEQTAKQIILPNDNVFQIEGAGYNNHGEVKSKSGEDWEIAKKIGFLGGINNEAGLAYKNDRFEHYGDSIDIAFLALSQKLKVNIDDAHILGRIPYESENKYSAVFYQENGQTMCTVKGSPEVVMSFCQTMRMGKKYENLDEKHLLIQNENLASQGYRVIAVATGQVKSKQYLPQDIKKLNFEGLVAFIDPIRQEAKYSIRECKTAGIKVVMITGDHPLTAFTIAKELGIVKHFSEVASGEEVTKYLKLGKEKFSEFVRTKSIFTRVSPLDKLEIVESYKAQEEFIAFAGDGVNDASAIRAANIGIAMGSGTDVAKETASMIITDDNFKSIVAGVKEGRTAYSNIRKVSYLLLSCGLAEVLIFLLAIAFNLPMPLVAIQILWLNIVTNSLQDFALSFEKSEKGIMNEKPRRTKESVFDQVLLKETLVAGLSMGLIVFAAWVYLIKNLGLNEYVARGYVMVLMVFMQNMHVLNCRSEKQSAFKFSLKQNPLIAFSIISAIILQIIIIEVPIFSNFLQTSAVNPFRVVVLFLISISILIIMEIYKKLVFAKKK